MSAFRPQNNEGFSLVELSIVLVILGLLVGGVLGGRSLIKSAELRSITQEVQQWQMAANAFAIKHGQLPGDYDQAAATWSGTWNGNGDGKVNFGGGGNMQGEIFTFWQQLALSGIIPGEFTGVSGPANNLDVIIGRNVPASCYPGGGYTVAYYNEGESYDGAWYTIPYGHHFEFGGKLDDWETGLPILTPEEAWSIDAKMDDGLPAKGTVIARYWNNLCSAADNGSHSDTNLEAHYRLTDSAVQCALIFRNMF